MGEPALAVTAADMRFNPPSFEVEVLARRVKEIYGLEGDWTSLEGERDQNFRLSCRSEDSETRRVVVKIAGSDEDVDVTDFQVQALLYLQANSPELPVPRIVPTGGGDFTSTISDTKGVVHVLRVVSYLPGIPYGEGEFADAEHLYKIGAFQARIVKAFAGFSHRAATHFMPWNHSNGIAVSEAVWANAEEDVSVLAAPMLDRLRDQVLPELNAGRSQVIHNDAHPYNLLRADAKSQSVVGLIDFGDMVYAPVVNEIAVMAATFLRRAQDDMTVVEHMLSGFHSELPLLDSEVTLLWDAIILRVLLTVLLSDIKLAMEGEINPSDLMDRQQAYKMLTAIDTLDHDAVVARFRSVCGYK